jgi:hypothetical protein
MDPKAQKDGEAPAPAVSTSRWGWMGPASLWITLASIALSGAALAVMWGCLKCPASLAPVWWSLGGATFCALGNLAGQTLALFGLFSGRRGRTRSLWALVLGIAGLAGLLAGIAFIFWSRGLLAL